MRFQQGVVYDGTERHLAGDGRRPPSWMFGQTIPHVFYLHTEINKKIYIDRWRRYASEIEFETTPPGGETPISTHVFLLESSRVWSYEISAK